MTEQSFERLNIVDIVKDSEGSRVVRLGFFIDIENTIKETLATISAQDVTLIRLRSDRKPHHFTLTAGQMDSLVTAWEMYQKDLSDTAEKEKAAYLAEVDAMCKRAAKVGATLITESINTNHDMGYYGTFSLRWPQYHPLCRYNTMWTMNDGLLLSTIEDRLATVEEHVKNVQTAKLADKEASNDEQMKRRASAVDAVFYQDAPNYYEFSFCNGHPFYKFWNSESLLSPGQVEYRLRYVEGVMNTPTDS